MNNRQVLEMMGQQQPAYNDVVAQVDFQFSEHPNPIKNRRQNIKNAIRALKPTKRSIFSLKRWWFGGRYRHTHAYQCVIDGTDCRGTDYGDLFDLYFRDDANQQIKKFEPWAGVFTGKGQKLNGCYCPQHMMLYHLLQTWLEEEDAEADPSFFSKLAKKGVALVPIVKADPIPKPPLIVKWEPIFKEAMKDGIEVRHFKDPETGENYATHLVFHNKMLQSKTASGNVLLPTNGTQQ